MDADVSHEGASTGLISASAQGSAFLRLPLEIRYQVYDHIIHFKVRRLTPYTLKPVTNLIGTSQQIRCEVYHLAAFTTFHISASIFSNSTLKLFSAAIKIKSINSRLAYCSRNSSWRTSTKDKGAERAFDEKRIQDLKNEIQDMEVPHQFKFWKVCVPVLNAYGMVRLVANINFKEKEVCVRIPGTVPGSFHGLDPAGSLKKAFVNVMQEFIKEEDFNGISTQDVSRFLERIDIPNPEGFWTDQEKFELLKEAEDHEQNEDTSSALT